tara:strand:- start:55 stop:378 length:324 start_codon:yes stop_codon:yes gene_type:complete
MERVLRLGLLTVCGWALAVPASAQLAQCTSALEGLETAAATVHEQSSSLETMRAGLVSRRDEFIRCQEEVGRSTRDRERVGGGGGGGGLPAQLDCSSAQLSAQSFEV